MSLPLKFLKQKEETILPITASEAVLVKTATGVKHLDDVLKMKIEEVVTPVGSGLTSQRIDNRVIIYHSNNINPSIEELKPKLIKYDNRGHITEASDFKKLKIIVNDKEYAQYDGSSNKNLQLGDDFENNDGKIQISWKTIT